MKRRDSCDEKILQMKSGFLFEDLCPFCCLIRIYQAESGLGIRFGVSQFPVGRCLFKNAAHSLYQISWIVLEGVSFLGLHGR